MRRVLGRDWTDDRFLLLLWPLVVFAVVGLFLACAEDRPNILIIYIDDLGWRDMSFMGSDFYETPNIDRLAEGGMVFTSAYSCGANCAPSRACILSGQYAPRHGVYSVKDRPRGDPRFRRLAHVAGRESLRPEITTWAESLRAAGYATAMLGKWQLGSKPSEHGFDVVVDHRDLEGYRHHLGPGGAHLTDTLTDRTIEFIEERRDGPWAVYLSHYAVHSPLQPRPDLLSIYQSKKQGSLHRNPELAAMIHGVDEGVGRIVAALEDLGEREDTIIFFTSDNGGWGDVTDMDPLRGYKGTFYEGGIRVPFIVSWPGHVEAGRTTTEPTIGVDLSPTLLELAGAETPNQPMDGVSLVPLLRGERDRLGPRAIYWHFPLYLQSLEVDDEQRDPLFRTRPCSIVRQGDYKLHQYFEDGALELYNLMRDPGELTNLADSEPKLRDELLGVLNQWRSDLDAVVPRETNPEFDEAAEKSARAQARNSKGL